MDSKSRHYKKNNFPLLSSYKEWEIAERAIKGTKELEKSLGLQQVEYKKSGDRRLKIGEYKQMERTNELSFLTKAKLFIDEILKDEPTTEEFVLSLQNETHISPKKPAE